MSEQRKLGRILPTERGNTEAAQKELDVQHEQAFREAVLLISSWVRAAYDMDRADFFKEMHRYLDNWEKDQTCPTAQSILNQSTGYPVPAFGTATHLPVVDYEGKRYFLDWKLNQIRNVDNPHDFKSLEDVRATDLKPVK